MMIIKGTKQKEETYGLIARTWVDAPVGCEIQIIQSNDFGGKSLEKIILNQFDNVFCESKNKARYITITKTESAPLIIQEWLGHTKIRMVDDIGFYSMPGLFGWDKIDAGSRLLLDYLPELKGVVADFGCGYGYLSKNILLKNKKIKINYCFDCDIRAIEACKMNVTDDRAITMQVDCTRPIVDIPQLDFIVMNPPFHDGVGEDKNLGQKFIETAAHHLRRNGQCWIVANKHLPYEKTIATVFFKHEKITEKDGFKIFKAVR